MKDRFELGPWTSVSAEGGGELALDGDRLIVAGASHLVIWQGEERVLGVDSPVSARGVPRVVGDRVYWGPGWVEAGAYEAIDHLIPLPEPGEVGARIVSSAWSPDGSRLVVVRASSSASTVELHTPAGATGAPLWEASDLPPEAVWIGDRCVIVGTRDLRVFSVKKRELARIDVGSVPAIRAQATPDERYGIAVEDNRAIHVFDPATGSVLARWPGAWADAAIGPHGRVIVAITYDEQMHVACFDGERIRELGRSPLEHTAHAVAVDAESVAIVGGGLAARARLSVQCTEG